jgi:riboflavin synthase
MFTGIVEELGTVAAVQRRPGGAVLAVACESVVADARVGDSISVNGVCLTVTTLTLTPLASAPPAPGGEGPPPRGFTADLMGETLDRTALGGLAPGTPVNLERALRADSRLGGHLVQGHVDGVTEVLAVEAHPSWTTMRFRLPPALSPYLVEKGSITVDGTSLTVLAVDATTFAVGLIPHTLAVTVLGSRRPGDRVNLEVDVVAKYVERMLRGGVPSPYIPEGT